MTYEIIVRGIVQGVGFRPYIYRVANSLGVTGYIINTSQNVKIVASGPEDCLNKLVSNIKVNKLAACKVTSIDVSRSTQNIEFNQFLIKDSKKYSHNQISIPPDLPVCNKCLEELWDSTNKRYKYPFINCTDCGPRYSLIQRIPYDRPSTTMVKFSMCNGCKVEYTTASDRRFHAQPIACWECGPKLELLDHNLDSVIGDPILTVIEKLKNGAIVAVKGIGGYHLMADATSKSAIELLRSRKQRKHKPLAVMAKSLKEVCQVCHVNKHEKNALNSYARPIVLLRKRENDFFPELLAPCNNNYGILLPYTPIHHLIIQDFKFLVCTSANINGSPIIHESNKDSHSTLTKLADFILTNDRDIHAFTDDSIVRFFKVGNTYQQQVVRRSRGFVPELVYHDKTGPDMLAVGAELKNTICLYSNRQSLVSQHIGDLKNTSINKTFTETIDKLRGITKTSPKAVVTDLHPNFLSTAYAESLRVPVLQCQHHHAHMCACMAENNLKEPVIGVIFDGMGLGSDMHLWGGEFLVGDYSKFTRFAHFQYFPLPGGDQCIKDIERSLVGFLYTTLSPSELRSFSEKLFMKSDKYALLLKMLQKSINSPLTSSLGRIFDAIAALLKIRKQAHFEGQAAIELEQLIDYSPSVYNLQPYSFSIGGNMSLEILLNKTMKQIIYDLEVGISLSLVSQKFHDTIVSIVIDVCEKARKIHKINKVVLSGGVFLNKYLLEHCIHYLDKKEFAVFYHTTFPPNDGNISLGQAAYGIQNYKTT